MRSIRLVSFLCLSMLVLDCYGDDGPGAWVHCTSNSISALARSSVGTTVLVGTDKGEVIVVDAEQRKTIQKMVVQGFVLRLLVDDSRQKWFCVSAESDQFHLYSGPIAPDGSIQVEWKQTVAEGVKQSQIAISPDGRFCVVSAKSVVGGKHAWQKYCLLAVSASSGEVLLSESDLDMGVTAHADHTIRIISGRFAFFESSKLVYLKRMTRRASTLSVFDLETKESHDLPRIIGAVSRLGTSFCGKTFTLQVSHRKRPPSVRFVLYRFDKSARDSFRELWKSGDFLDLYEEEVGCDGVLLATEVMGQVPPNRSVRFFRVSAAKKLEILSKSYRGEGSLFSAWHLDQTTASLLTYFPAPHEVIVADLKGRRRKETYVVPHSSLWTFLELLLCGPESRFLVMANYVRLGRDDRPPDHIGDVYVIERPESESGNGSSQSDY